jgi:hypothetical protein
MNWSSPKKATSQGRHRIVLESRPQMAAQVLARHHLQFSARLLAVGFFMGVIETMELIRDPPGVVLC